MTNAEPHRGDGDLPRAVPWRSYALITGMAVVLVALLIAAAVPFVAPEAGLEPGPLVLITGRDDSVGRQRIELVREWNVIHKANPVQIVELPPVADAQRSEMVARAQAGGGVDVFNLDVTWTAEFAEAGYLAPIDERTVEAGDFLGRPLDSCRDADGRLWALPFNTDLGLLYYRRDLLQRLLNRPNADPPRTWNDLQSDVEEIRRTGYRGPAYVGQFDDYEGLTVNALELVRGAGGEIVDAGGAVTAGSHLDQIETAFDRLGVLSFGLEGQTEDESTEAFRSGGAVFMRNWPRAFLALSATREAGQPDREIGVTTLPDGSGILGGQNLAVSSRSERPRAARALVDFLTSDRSAQILFDRGGLPAARSVVFEDPEVQRRYPFAAELRAGLDDALPRPSLVHYARFSEAVRQPAREYANGSRRSLPPDFVARVQDGAAGRIASD
ncbi:ABC transporter substrate-binding protein [Actinomycetospora chlora]|uniref:ABC transporter substrate-binding protein n=1 Tax=Actinomycetospora chlora TaxID=663608 RepID=A0ABP9B8I2_9PSEU